MRLRRGRRAILSVLGIIVLLALVVACTADPSPTPTSTPSPEFVPTPTATPTGIPSESPSDGPVAPAGFDRLDEARQRYSAEAVAALLRGHVESPEGFEYKQVWWSSNDSAETRP